MIYAQFLMIWRGGENCKMEELDSLEWRHIKPLLVSQFSFLVFSGNRVYLLFTHRTFRFLNPCQEKIRKENAVKYAILYTELDDHWSSSEVAKISIYFTSIIGHQQLRLNWTGGIVDRVQIDIWSCRLPISNPHMTYSPAHLHARKCESKVNWISVSGRRCDSWA